MTSTRESTITISDDEGEGEEQRDQDQQQPGFVRNKYNLRNKAIMLKFVADMNVRNEDTGRMRSFQLSEDIRVHWNKPLGSAMKSFAVRVGVKMGQDVSLKYLRFVYDGRLLNGEMSANSCHMESGDQIDVFWQQTGGVAADD